MTDQQKKQIEIYRELGLSYTVIGKKLGLSVNSIKTHCRRHGFGGVRAFNNSGSDNVHECEYCGIPVVQKSGRKRKRFCSDKCRNNWWNSHQDQVNRKANYECVCGYCGKSYISYGNKNRKYCSHECYIEDRFGGAH